MFGASEDRARQLAGRQRWKRISSNGSDSSSRSGSTSSQLSQLSHHETSSIFEQNQSWPTMFPEHPAPTSFVSIDCLHDFGGLQRHVQHIASSDIEEAFSRMLSKNLHPRTLQQRSQTEYLSQVLYDDTASDDAFPPLPSPSVAPSQTKQYGVLGWGAKILQQVRHATEPASHAQTEDCLSTAVTAHDLVGRSISVDLTSTQPAVSMRGGANSEPRVPWDVVRRHVLWNTPFNTSRSYHRFMDQLRRLSPRGYDVFVTYFCNNEGREADPIRQRLMSGLGPKIQPWIWHILEERAKAILGSALHEGTQSESEIQQIRMSSLVPGGPPGIIPRNLFLALMVAGG
jgi:hypothetical protein